MQIKIQVGNNRKNIQTLVERFLLKKPSNHADSFDGHGNVNLRESTSA
jgi:hypothetical protein